MSLSTAAGWNQTIEDWELLLTLGVGFGLRDNDRLIGTAVALPHPPAFGWVGMVLVTPQFQRRGHASRLLMQTVDYLMGLGLVPMLDATPAGRAVYERLGFFAVEEISRWRRDEGSASDMVEAAGVLPIPLALDREAFGADRASLLTKMFDRAGSQLVADPSGYVLSRRGRTATQIGPAVLLDQARGTALLNAAISQINGPAIIDVPDLATTARAAVVAAGFRVERPLTRMALGRSKAFGVPQMVAAIAGPEFG